MSKKASLNQKVPPFTIPSSAKSEFILNDLKGKKIILYFYPKDNTPGCTTEGIEFNKLLSQFKKQNALVFGISRDNLNSHDKFIRKFDFKFDLLSDEDESLCQLFDVIKEKNMYGKKVMGIERSTFVIDENLILVGEFRKVKALGHAAEILSFLKTLKS